MPPPTLDALGYTYVPGKTGSPNDLVLSPPFAWAGQENYNQVA